MGFFNDIRKRFSGVTNLGMAPPTGGMPPQDISEGAQMQAQAPNQGMPSLPPPMQQPPIDMARQDAAIIQQQPQSMFTQSMDRAGNRFDDRMSMWDRSTGLMDFAKMNNQYNIDNNIQPNQPQMSSLMAQDPNQMNPYRTYGGGY